MPAEIQAGHLFPVPRFVKEQNPQEAAERHRDLIAQALNEVAAAAFAPWIYKDSSTSTQVVNSTTPVTYPGLSLDVLSSVPARADVRVVVDVRATTWTDVGQGAFIGRLKRGSTVIAEGLYQVGAQGARMPFALISADESLLPRVVYTYTLEVLLTSAGTNVFSVNVGSDALRAQMTAVVLPRILT